MNISAKNLLSRRHFKNLAFTKIPLWFRPESSEALVLSLITELNNRVGKSPLADVLKKKNLWKSSNAKKLHNYLEQLFEQMQRNRDNGARTKGHLRQQVSERLSTSNHNIPSSPCESPFFYTDMHYIERRS